MTVTRHDLAALVALARIGRAGPLAEVVGPRLYAHARRLADDAESARDVVQSAWVAILQGLGGLRDDHAFLAWALRIVTRAAARRVAGRQRARGVASDLAVLQPQAESEANADRQDLAAALAALPAEMRATLALFYLEEMSVAEVAIALDIPPGTVKTRLMHGRARLRAALTGEDHGQV